MYQTKTNIKTLIPLLLITIALLMATTACEPAPTAPELPDIELPNVPSPNIPGNILDDAPTQPTVAPSPTATRPAPTVTPAPTPSPTATAPVAMEPANVVLVPRLEIAEVPADLPDYSRKDWKHWTDTDRDCQNTRAEVLIEESTASPAFATADHCRVTGGSWNGPYTGQTFTDAVDLDIDHLVPLKNAHLSGGWQWDAARKEDFANSMAPDYHLIAVEKYANRAKGARGPEEWQPPDPTYHCQYARDWIAVKSAWGLTANPAEWAALESMLATCAYPVRIGDATGTVIPTLAPAPTSVATTTPPAITTAEPQSGALVITEIMPDPSAVRDTAGEWFEVHNPNPQQTVNLEGWTIRNEGGDQHRIATEILLPPGGYLVLARNSDATVNGGIAAAYQYGKLSLTNDGDVIELVDPAGQVADRVAYTEELVFPGASTSLTPSALDSTANDNPANWCRAATSMPNGDFGTPGQKNDPCP